MVVACAWALMGHTPVSKNPCAGANTQLDMNICSHEQYQKADKRLNMLYKKIQAMQSQKAHRLRFQKAQLAWLKFRDLQCEHRAMVYEGGSIMPLIRNGCLERLTVDRNAYFEMLLKTMPQ